MNKSVSAAEMLSLVVPVYNEAGNLKKLFQKIIDVLPRIADRYEIIFVNDGSDDGSEEILNELFRDYPFVGGIHLYKNFGKTPALEQGFEIARGDIILTLDSDLQNDPEDFGILMEKMKEGYDLVAGRRQGRKDPGGKVFTSRIFNWMIRKSTGLKLKDYFTGMRCYRRRVLKALNLYGDLYRFALVFAHFDGFRVDEVPIRHNPRFHGDSKYSRLGRIKRAFSDLLIVLFTIKFNYRRIYLLGMSGYAFTSLGLIVIFGNYLLRLWGWITGFGIIITSIGVLLIFLGLHFLIFKKIADNFVSYHLSARSIRKKYIKRIIRPSRNHSGRK